MAWHPCVQLSNCQAGLSSSGLLCGPWLAGAVGRSAGRRFHAPTPEVGLPQPPVPWDLHWSFPALAAAWQLCALPCALCGESYRAGAPGLLSLVWTKVLGQGMLSRCVPPQPGLSEPGLTPELARPCGQHTLTHTLTFGPAAHPEELTTQPHIPSGVHMLCLGLPTRVTYSHGQSHLFNQGVHPCS